MREQEMEGFRAQALHLPLTALVGAASGGGLTIARIPVAQQKSFNDSTTGSFKLGHYLNDDVLIYVAGTLTRDSARDWPPVFPGNLVDPYLAGMIPITRITFLGYIERQMFLGTSWSLVLSYILY